MVCSDGAYCPINCQAAHGWVFASEVNSSIVDGSGLIEGHPDLFSSYHAELGGILALLSIECASITILLQAKLYCFATIKGPSTSLLLHLHREFHHSPCLIMTLYI